MDLDLPFQHPFLQANTSGSPFIIFSESHLLLPKDAYKLSHTLSVLRAGQSLPPLIPFTLFFPLPGEFLLQIFPCLDTPGRKLLSLKVTFSQRSSLPSLPAAATLTAWSNVSLLCTRACPSSSHLLMWNHLILFLLLLLHMSSTCWGWLGAWL